MKMKTKNQLKGLCWNIIRVWVALGFVFIGFLGIYLFAIGWTDNIVKYFCMGIIFIWLSISALKDMEMLK